MRVAQNEINFHVSFSAGDKSKRNTKNNPNPAGYRRQRDFLLILVKKKRAHGFDSGRNRNLPRRDRLSKVRVYKRLLQTAAVNTVLVMCVRSVHKQQQITKKSASRSETRPTSRSRHVSGHHGFCWRKNSHVKMPSKSRQDIIKLQRPKLYYSVAGACRLRRWAN